jgi:hypothetical protein
LVLRDLRQTIGIVHGVTVLRSTRTTNSLLTRRGIAIVGIE